MTADDAKADAAPKGGRRRGQVATVQAVHDELERLWDLLVNTGPSEVFLKRYGQSSPIPDAWRAARKSIWEASLLVWELIEELEARNEARDARLKVERRAAATARLANDKKCGAIVTGASGQLDDPADTPPDEPMV